jgi:hypothetical protein
MFILFSFLFSPAPNKIEKQTKKVESNRIKILPASANGR